MKDNFVERVDVAAALVRKRDLRKLGESDLAHDLQHLLQRRLLNPPDACSPVLVGDTLLSIFIAAIESVRPTDVGEDTPQRRQYTYLHQHLLDGREWAVVAEDLGVARSTFYEIQKAAIDRLAIALWRLEEEALMPRRVIHNLPRPPFSKFIERYLGDANYVDEVVIPELRRGRAWVVAIRGAAGTGKSSLAFAVAQRCIEQAEQQRLPYEAVIWIGCRAEEYDAARDSVTIHSLPTTMSTILDTIGATLGQRRVLQCNTDEKREIVRQLLTDRVCLLVLDNLDSEWLPTIVWQEIEQFLRELPPPNKVLATQRNDQSWEGQKTIQLQDMPKDEALRFTTQEAEARGLLSFSETEFGAAYEKTHGNPLALKQALSLVRVFGYPLEKALDFGHSAGMLDFMYEKAYDKLPSDAKRMLVTMPLFVDAASQEALESASNMSGPEQLKALGWLYRGLMIEKVQDEQALENRYTLLPFARAYLRNLRREPSLGINGQSVSDIMQDAYRRLADYYRRLSRAYSDRIDSLLLLMKSDRHTILSLLEWAKANKEYDSLIDLFDVVGVPLGILRYLELRRSWGEVVVQACRSLNRDADANWYLVRDVVWALVRIGTEESRSEGRRLLETARVEAEANQWDRNLALILRNAGRLATDEGALDKAQAYLEESASLWGSTDVFWRMITKQAIADVHVLKASWKEAEDILRELESDFATAGNNDGIVQARAALAVVLVQMDQAEEARLVSEQGIGLAEQIKAPASALAYALLRRSTVEAVCGELASAINYADRARALYESLGMKWEAGRALNIIAQLRAKMAQQQS